MRRPLALACALAALPAAGAAQMTTFEQQVLAEMNQARTDPAGYARHIERLLQYLDGDLLRIPGEVALRTSEGARAVREAVAALRAQGPLPALAPSPGLARAWTMPRIWDRGGNSGTRDRTGRAWTPASAGTASGTAPRPRTSRTDRTHRATW
jgi:hypothetical protein